MTKKLIKNGIKNMVIKFSIEDGKYPVRGE